jgi:hypothetical protein
LKRATPASTDPGKPGDPAATEVLGRAAALGLACNTPRLRRSARARLRCPAASPPLSPRTETAEVSVSAAGVGPGRILQVG